MSRYAIETQTPNGVPITVPIPDEFIDMIQSQYAHKLAELIRSESGVGSSWEDAADLIDPEA